MFKKPVNESFLCNMNPVVFCVRLLLWMESYLIHRKLFSIVTCSQYDSCFFAFNQAGRNKRDGKLFLNVSNVFLQTYCNVKHQKLDNNGQYLIMDVHSFPTFWILVARVNFYVPCFTINIKSFLRQKRWSFFFRYSWENMLDIGIKVLFQTFT